MIASIILPCGCEYTENYVRALCQAHYAELRAKERQAQTEIEQEREKVDKFLRGLR